MRLVFDLTGLQTKSRFRGIGRFTGGLARGLIETAGGHEVWLAAAANHAESLDALRSQFTDLPPTCRLITYRVLDQVEYGRQSHRWRRMAGEFCRDHFFASLDADVVLFPSMFEAYNEDAITCCTHLCADTVRAVVAHDLIPLASPDEYFDSPSLRAWYFEKLDHFLKCDIFLANSAATARELADYLDLAPDRIETIGAAADVFMQSAGAQRPAARLDARFTFSRPFFVYTASFEARKNFGKLIAAFGRIAARLSERHRLVLVTSNADAALRDIRDMAQQAGLGEDDVIVTGYISDDAIRQLYRRCVALVYPSLHEGFGLPVLEAMQCGAAVIGSNSTSLPEIIGLGEAMFDPNSIDEIADAMFRVAEDTAFRDRLRHNAQVRRGLYSWTKSATAAWKALEKTLRSRGSRRRASRAERYAALVAALRSLPQADAASAANDLRMLCNAIAENGETLAALSSRLPANADRVWRIEGPFDSNYSLALLNRESARALRDSGQHVALASTEGPGDYAPDEDFLARNHSDILHLWRSRSPADDRDHAVIVCRNLFPPRVHDARGDLNLLLHYAWEESRFPREWVDRFNLHLDAIACNSRHVLKVLQDNGVIAPMAVIGCGVDHFDSVVPSKQRSFPGRSFRFLHVSSCFPRKGVDVLLQAYGQAFRRSDDVSLLIKTFANPHNDIEAQVAAARLADPHFPDVVIIFDDLADNELKALYQHCHVLVAPSRAEGFGLPVAEAMLSGIPVIATNWSGHLDFCNDETAWLVDYSFAPARTHFALSSSVWAEPDPGHLALRMREAHQATAAERAQKAAAGRDRLRRDHTWSTAVGRLNAAVDRWAAPRRRTPPHLGFVSTWNCTCGIATHSEHLIRWLPNRTTIFGAADDVALRPDDARVVRAWHRYTPGARLDELAAAVDRAGVDVVVIQFNFYFYDFAALEQFVVRQKQKKRTVLIILHSTIDPPRDHTKQLARLAACLRACDRVLVHSYHDLNRLKSVGVVENACLFPHGIIDGPRSDFRPTNGARKFVIGTYGFCLPHKGLPELVTAFALLARRDRTLWLHLTNAKYSHDHSAALIDELRALIARLKIASRVRLTTDYLSDDDALASLRACDLVVFPYRRTSESASGAVRFGIASGRPVLTTDEPIFDDVKTAVYQVENSEPGVLAAGLRDVIAELRAGGPGVAAKADAANRWRQDHAYEAIAARLSGLAEALHFAGD